MVKLNQECKCKEVLRILKQAQNSIEEKYSNYQIVDADFVRTQKAMAYEKINGLFRAMKIEEEV